MFKGIIIENVHTEQIYLFGSYAYGTPRKDSDIDIYIVMKDDANMRETETMTEVDSIDNICKDEKVSFIKMDIEGAELNALKGAKNQIKINKPKLAICVYHKKEDLITIPQYILSLNPDYKLYLRHYSHFGWELVLYAV